MSNRLFTMVDGWRVCINLVLITAIRMFPFKTKNTIIDGSFNVASRHIDLSLSLAGPRPLNEKALRLCYIHNAL